MTPPRGPESRYHGVARVSRQGMRDQPVPSADQEASPPLAAMISAVADGKPLTALDRARMRVLMVDQALERGLSWAMIATAFGYPSGRQAKKMIHDLKARVQRELMLEQNREACGPRHPA